MKKIVMIFVVFFSLTHAKSYDVTKFDISGISLGMDSDKVLDIIKNKYNAIDRKTMQWNKITKPNYEVIYSLNQKNNHVNIINVELKEAKIMINFSKYESSINKSKVEEIIYSSKQNKNNENEFYNLAIQKFGQPSSILKNSFEKNSFWCNKLYKTSTWSYSGFRCSEKMNPNATSDFFVKFTQPYLKLTGTTLRLYNPLPSIERALQKEQEQNLNQKPSF